MSLKGALICLLTVLIGIDAAKKGKLLKRLAKPKELGYKLEDAIKSNLKDDVAYNSDAITNNNDAITSNDEDISIILEKLDILQADYNALKVDVGTNTGNIDANFKSINKAEIINLDSCKTIEWTIDCNRGVWLKKDRVFVGANSTYGCINWYGYGYHETNGDFDGSISTTFSGNGRAELDFGNCFDDPSFPLGTVYAYLDGNEIASASKETPNLKVEFGFNDESILKITEVQGVIQLNSLEIIQCN